MILTIDPAKGNQPTAVNVAAHLPSASSTIDATGVNRNVSFKQINALARLLSLGERGLMFYPLPKDLKKCMHDIGWSRLATNHTAQLRGWFKQYPDCNWAVTTGSKCHVFVVDVDGQEGFNTIEKMAAIGLDLPQTLVTVTANPASRHYLFRYPGNAIIRNCTTLLPGIDIRGEGGYVVVPPSTHPNGQPYTFIDECAEISLPPSWLLGLAVDRAAL